MKLLKKTVYISFNVYIDFERECICYKGDEIYEIHLTPTEIKIIKLLCEQFEKNEDGYVSNIELFNRLYGYQYNKNELNSGNTINDVTRAMSRLRSKKILNCDDCCLLDLHEVIQSLNNGYFKIQLLESPFEFTEDTYQRMESSGFINIATKNHATTLTIVSITGQWIFSNESDQKEVLAFLNNGGLINVIINTKDVANLLIANMANDNNFYLPYDEVVRLWEQLRKKYPNQIRFNQIDAPILHATLYADCYKEALSALIVYVYTYPDSYDLPNLTFLLEGTSPYFELFYREIKKLESQI